MPFVLGTLEREDNARGVLGRRWVGRYLLGWGRRILRRLETSHEKAYVKWLDKYVLWEAIKIHRRGWPDRLVIGPKAVTFWIEFKRDDKEDLRLTQDDVRVHLIEMGFYVYVCRSAAEAKEVTRKRF